MKPKSDYVDIGWEAYNGKIAIYVARDCVLAIYASGDCTSVILENGDKLTTKLTVAQVLDRIEGTS